MEHAGLWTEEPGDVGMNAVEEDTSAWPSLYFCATLSKAFGGFGGILPGSHGWIEQIKRDSRYYTGASAPPTPAAAATARALEIVMASPTMRVELHKNVGLLKSGLRRLGLDVEDTPVPIICLRIGSADNMRRIQEELMRRGIAVAYFSAYSGLGSNGGLRLAVFATHTESMISQLLTELAGVV